jgi:hypothetical protein
MSRATQPRPSADGSYEAGSAGFAGGSDRAFAGARAVDFPVHGGLNRRNRRHALEIPAQCGNVTKIR